MRAGGVEMEGSAGGMETAREMGGGCRVMSATRVRVNSDS